jgi:hypothetical protein
MKSLLRDSSYILIARSLAICNIPLQTLIFANFLSLEDIFDFFIISSISSLIVLFEGGSGTVLTYEYNRATDSPEVRKQLIADFRRRFFRISAIYILASIITFKVFNAMNGGLLHDYFWPFLSSVLITTVHFLIYPCLCLAEGDGKVSSVLILKTIAPVVGMLLFLSSILITGGIYHLYLVPVGVLLCYCLTISVFWRRYFGELFVSGRGGGDVYNLRRNVFFANISWGSGYILTQGFPLLLPIVLDPANSARLMMSSNLLTAFIAFLCVGASLVGPRIPSLLKNSDFSFITIFRHHLVFIYLLLGAFLIFFEPLYHIFIYFFDESKFLPPNLLFIFCVSFLYLPCYHYSVVLLKGFGVEPFAFLNTFSAIVTLVFILLFDVWGIYDFLFWFIWLRILLGIVYGSVMYYHYSKTIRPNVLRR